MQRIVKYLSVGRELRYFVGDSLCSLQKDGFFFYIKNGSFKITVQRPDGTNTDFSYCRAGTVLQTNRLVMDTKPWDPADCVAMENSVVVQFTREQFRLIIANDSLMFDEYVDNASTYTSLLKQRLLVTAGLNSGQRLLTWIDKLCQCNEATIDGVYEIDCPLTQQQIADYLFIHVTTCNKLFSKLNKERIVRYQKGKLTVFQYQKLQEYLEKKFKII
jgi:CRP/FNR family cyclic AMP-dependent transcriptional regulator